MNPMKYVISIVVSLLVGLGFGYLVFHNGATPQPAPVGGLYNINKTQFVNGFTAGTTEQFSVASTGALTTSGALTVTGAFTASNSGNTGTVVTAASGTATTTVNSGAVCVANAIGATSTISTYASTTGTTLTVKGAPSAAFQYICF